MEMRTLLWTGYVTVTGAVDFARRLRRRARSTSCHLANAHAAYAHGLCHVLHFPRNRAVGRHLRRGGDGALGAIYN